MSNDERQMGLLLNALAFAGLIVPFGNIIGPLVIWLLKKDQSPYLNAQGKAVLNFNISVMIYMFIAGILCIVLIGFILLPIIGIAWLIITILAVVKSSEGQIYSFPLTIPLLK